MAGALYQTRMTSPWGLLRLYGTVEALVALEMAECRYPFAGRDTALEKETPALRAAKRELESYFAGRLKNFTVDFDLAGTDFQTRVWQALARVPYGKTVAYSDLAAAIGQPNAVRAVALANARNPLPIIVPCHRVIGKNGALTGYSSGGVTRKAALLRLEGLTLPH